MNILCYGDSNTWGYIPNVNGYSKNSVMKQYNDSDCWWFPLTINNNVYIDGLCGRTINSENPWLSGRNASLTIKNDLKKYNNLDLIILQLGTNDCKNAYGYSATIITEQMENFIYKIKECSSAKHLLLSPAQICENSPITKKYYLGASVKSAELNEGYARLSKKLDIGFISGLTSETGEDGEHLSIYGHKCLGEKVNSFVHNLNSSLEVDISQI